MKANLHTIQSWAWFKKMPKLMQELFISKWNYGTESVSFAKKMAEEKYFDIMSLVQETR